MEPEAADAILIADKYLPEGPAEERIALAKEILEAIIRHAGRVAFEEITKAFNMGNPH